MLKRSRVRRLFSAIRCENAIRHENETERVSCEVEEHAERLAGLEFSLVSPDRKHLLLSSVEVRYVEIEMRLLGMLGAWPHRGLMVRYELKGDRRSAVAAEFYPASTPIVDLPSRYGAVEVCESSVVRAVESHDAETGNTSHGDIVAAR